MPSKCSTSFVASLITLKFDRLQLALTVIVGLTEGAIVGVGVSVGVALAVEDESVAVSVAVVLGVAFVVAVVV